MKCYANSIILFTALNISQHVRRGNLGEPAAICLAGLVSCIASGNCWGMIDKNGLESVREAINFSCSRLQLESFVKLDGELLIYITIVWYN